MRLAPRRILVEVTSMPTTPGPLVRSTRRLAGPGRPASPAGRRLRQWAMLAVFASGAVPGFGQPADQTEEEAQRWARFQPSFDAFAEADRENPPVPGGILFLGSSIFRQWTNAAEMMAPLPVLNRAFGGSRTTDQLTRFNELTPRYLPSIIVYYCGSNDLNAGHEPAAIFSRFKEFSQRVASLLPDTRIVFVSSMRSPDREDRWDRVDAFNQLVAEYCSSTPHHAYVDVNPRLVDDAGNPRLELFRSDRLHLNPPAYEEFAAVIRPTLERLWAEVESAR
jgi:lysophospholipase L1-like esterase